MYNKYIKYKKKYLQKGGNNYNIEIITTNNNRMEIILNESYEINNDHTLKNFLKIHLPTDYKNKFILTIHNIIPSTIFYEYSLNTKFSEIRTEDNKIKLFIKFSNEIKVRFKALNKSESIILNYYDYTSLSFKNITDKLKNPIYNNKYTLLLYDNKICIPSMTISLLEISDFNNTINIDTIIILDIKARRIIDRLADEKIFDIRIDEYIYDKYFPLYCYYLFINRPDMIQQYIDGIYRYDQCLVDSQVSVLSSDEYAIAIQQDISNGVELGNGEIIFNRKILGYLRCKYKLHIYLKYFYELVTLVIDSRFISNSHIVDICKILEKYLPDILLSLLIKYLRIKPRMLLSITSKFQEQYLPILPKMLKYEKIDIQEPYFDNL